MLNSGAVWVMYNKSYEDHLVKMHLTNLYWQGTPRLDNV